MVNINLSNYKNKNDGVERIFDDNKRHEIDLLKVKRLYKKDDVKLLNQFLKQLARSKKNYPHANNFSHAKNSSSFTDSTNQLCVAKMRFGTSKDAHLKFVTLYMPQKNKAEVIEKPELFGDDIEEYKAHAVAKHFKFIISPENQNVDLEHLTKTFIKQFNALYDLDVRYLAVQHNDTGHKHVHLVINGVDKNGKTINRIPKNFIKYTLHDILAGNCTVQVGKRSMADIARYKNQNIQRTRITPIDERIKMQMTENKNMLYPYKITTINPETVKRLEFLENLQLAKKLRNTYFLKSDWYESLKTMGRYNVFLSIKNDYAFTNKPTKIYTNDETISGRVLKIFNMDDEQIWQNGIVLETDKAVYYVPSFYKVDTSFYNKAVTITPSTKHAGAINIREINTEPARNKI